MVVKRNITKRKGGPVPKEKKEEVMNKLRMLIESGQISGITNQQLSSQFEVQRETIGKYLDEIYLSVPPEDLKRVMVDFSKLFDRLFREANKMLSEAEGHKQKESTMRLILQLLREKTDYLERFFVKDKAVDKIQADITQKSINIQIIDDRTQVKEAEQ